MALINCPECGREISEKVKACPHCGYPIREINTENEELQRVEISSVNLNVKKIFRNKKLLIGIGLVIIIALFAMMSVIFVKNRNEKIAFNIYVDNLDTIRLAMLSGASEAETLNNLTARVWYNSIYEENDPETDKFTKENTYSFYDDFNISLGKLFTDSSTLATISEIEDNQDVVSYIMKDLQNPPEDLVGCYETVTDLYLAYKGLTDLAINPTGSLESFSDEKNERVDSFMNLYDRLKTQIPEKIK